MAKVHTHTILLGSAGTGTAFAAAMSLRRVWSQSVGIVAMDINPGHLVSTSVLADAFEQVPPSASDMFSKVLAEVLDKHAVDTYLPLFPEEIALVARLKEEGQIPDSVTVLAPPPDGSALCADKEKLTVCLAGRGLLVPKTALASQPFQADHYFLKRKSGAGSHGARKVGAEELTGLLGSLAEEWIVQEVCGGPEVTVDAFFDPAGDCFTVCRERLEIKTGVSTKCRLFEDKILHGYALEIARTLELRGSFCFQVMHHADGWAVTDVNPRPGAATAMCAAAGNDFFAAAFAFGWGEPVSRFFRPLDGDRYVTRQYAEFLMPCPA